MKKPVHDAPIKGEAIQLVADVAVTEQAVTILPDEHGSEDIVEEFIVQLLPAGAMYVDGCSRKFVDWMIGSTYICIICTNCDLCEYCFAKIDRCSKSEPWTDWQRYCGPDHRYIRGSIPGWKGVRDGVMRFEYSRGGGVEGKVEETNLTDWLDGVQDRWSQAWKGFWGKEEVVIDIL